MLGIVKPLPIAVTKNVIPAYLRDENPNLIAFMKHYYEWMSQNGNVLDYLQNMIEYRDIGTVSDDSNSIYFTNLIINQLADFIPAAANIDRGIFVQNIRDFYIAKGTLPSYEFILNALFNSTASLQWNSERVMRPSSNLSVRDAAMFVYSTLPWDVTATGVVITQTYPTVASATIDLCTPTIINGKVVNVLDLDPESVVGDFSVGGLVQVLRNTVDRSWTYVSAYYSAISNTSTTITCGISLEVPRTYPNLVVRQIGSTYRAIISQLNSRVISNGRYNLTFAVNSVTGVLGTGDLYFVDSKIENTVFTKADYLTGTISPTIVDIKITNGGALNVVGDIIPYVGGTGSTMSAKINSIGSGSVDTIVPITNGYGYSVGDVLSSAPVEGQGGGLVAHVDNIDGIGASIGSYTELDGFNIRFGGDSFSVGDLISVQGGTTQSSSHPTILQVTSINSTIALNKIKVLTGGYGYNYTKLALLNKDTNSLVSGFAATANVTYGSITSVTITSFPSISTANCIAILNGYGATLTPNMTMTPLVGGVSTAPISNGALGGQTGILGSITSINIVTGGWNYIDPIVVVNSPINPIRVAQFSITKDVNGIITGVTVLDGGDGYPNNTSISIVEMFGQGATLNTVINGISGPITGLSIIQRGTYSHLPTCFQVPYVATTTQMVTINGVSGEGVSSNTISSGSISGQSSIVQYSQNIISLGEELILDLKFRVKSVYLNNSGSFYKQPIVDSSYGIGNGAIFTPQIINGVITTIAVSQGGQGYNHASVMVNGTGVGFKGIVNLAPITITSSTVGASISSVPMSGSPFGGGATLTTSNNYVASITIIDGGIGYSNGDQVTIYGDGVGAVASLSVSNGVVKQIIVNNGGVNYAYDTSFSYVMEPIANPTSVAGSFTPNIQNGVIKSITVNNGGSGYIGLTNDLKNEDTTYLLFQDGITKISFDSSYDIPRAVGGNPANITISTAGIGGILSGDIVSGGTGYYSVNEIPPLEIYVNTTTGYGAVVMPILELGRLTSFKILHGGFNYSSTDTLSIVGGLGTGASLQPKFNNGKLSNIIILNTGSGYRYGTSLLVVGNGRGADIYADINTSISEIVVSYGGIGYINPTVVIADMTGPGTGASAIAVTENGVITRIAMVSGGTGYVTPRVTVYDVNGTGALLKAQVPRFIEAVTINSEGSNYTFADVYVVGDGNGAVISLDIEKDGSLFNPSVSSQGTGYTADPQFIIEDISGYGAITSIQIIQGGSGYVKSPIVTIPNKYIGQTLIATGASFVSWGQNIGSVTGVAFTTFGGDWTEAPKFDFSINTVMEENVNFTIGETVNIASYPYKQTDTSFAIKMDDTTSFTGSINGTTLTVLSQPIWNLQVGATLSGTGIAVGNTIVKQLTGPTTSTGLSTISDGAISSGSMSGATNYTVGGLGTYQVSISQIASSTTITSTNIDDGVYLYGEYKLQPLSQEIDNASSLFTEDGLYEIVAEDIGFGEQEFYEIFNLDGTSYPYYDAGPNAVVNAIDFSTNTLELASATDSVIISLESGDVLISESGLSIVDQTSNGINIGDELIGVSSKAQSTILWFNRTSGIPITSGIGFTKKTMVNSTGVLNNPLSEIQDGQRINDYAYVVRTGASLNQYKQILVDTIHPAGYQLYGDVVLGTFGGGNPVNAPYTFGVKGADSSFSTTINIKDSFVNTNLSHNKNFWYYNRTKQYFYTTQGILFSSYSFNNYDINSIDFISNHTPLAVIEPWVAKTFQYTGLSCITDSGLITGVTDTTGIANGYRVIAYNSLGGNIFRENRIMLETAVDHLLVEDGSMLDTDESITTVSSFTSTTITASKPAKETDTGTVTIAVQNIPSLGLA